MSLDDEPLDPRLRGYQLEAVEHLRMTDRAALLLDMGLGKTASTLQALQERHLPALVIAPKRVAEHVWPAEARTWRPSIPVRVASGAKATRLASHAKPGERVIVASTRDNTGDLTPGMWRRYRTVIIDESSSFKNPSAIRTRNVRRGVVQPGGPEHVWLLTGTPAANGLIDLWAQYSLLDDGEALGRNITAYRSRYFYKDPYKFRYDLKPGAADAITARIEPMTLSMDTAGRVELPEVTYNDVAVELPAKVRAFYEKLRKHAVAELDELRAEGKRITATTAAAVAVKLSQVTAGFVYDEEKGVTELHRAKIDALREVVDSAQGSGVLVAYRFQAEEDMLRAAFPEADTVKSEGFQERWDRGETPVLLAHPESAGHGLNLQHGGHTVVWTSPTWAGESYAQLNKRLHRSGQRRPVVIHHLLATGTLDRSILSAVQGKVDVNTALVQGLSA